jgi:HK97 family phage major capsid protein
MASITQKRQDAAKLYQELEGLQGKIESGEATEAQANDALQKVNEVKAIQAEIDRFEEVAALTAKGREIPRDVPLPADGPNAADREAKGRTVRTTPGEMFVTSQAYQEAKQMGGSGFSRYATIGNGFGRPVQLSGKAAADFIERKAAAALPVNGVDGIIPFSRDPELVRQEGEEILNLATVFNQLSTETDTVHYVSYIFEDRGAVVTGRGQTKPYLNFKSQPNTVPVVNLPVLSKITEQDLADSARLAGLINTEMALDIRQAKEFDLLWGPGGSGNTTGLFAAGIPEFDRAQSGDTLIDTIRRMRTNVRKRKVMATTLMITPEDWEDVELTKSSDDEHYIWAVITTPQGPRIWGLNVVEVDSLENAATGERRMVVANPTMGASIYTRSATQLAVGYVDDDFEKNLRTLRAEERYAFAVKRPFAFEYAVTAAEES